MEQTILRTPPPPRYPELPDGATPRWPAWYAPAAFVVGLLGTVIAAAIVAAVTGWGEDDVELTIVATLLQGVIFVGTALLFANFKRRPRAWQFGLRRTPFWPTVGWAALGMVSFYAFAVAYGVIVSPDAEQSVTEALGADQGTLGLIVAGVMVICVAPFAEELFFRGFFYRALRSRFSVIVAALIDGLLFGIIHYDFSGADALLILPPLAALGFMFCLVLERTGSLWPVVGLHALNNAIAYGVAVEDAAVSLVLGPLMLLACATLPRLGRPAPALS